nr:PIG-L deacetylase family protein [Variovorax sp. dw_954]
MVLAPHADDEVLGMGGTIARLVAENRRVVVAVVTGHGEDPHPLWPAERWELVRAECKAACAILGVDELIFRELPAACLDSLPAWKINSVIQEIVAQVRPSELYVPFGFDLHKDHGAISYAASVVARPYTVTGQSIARVLAYETLSETNLAPPYMAPAFQPNVFVNISETIDKKIEAMQAYQSQLQPENMPRSTAAIRSLAHLRGTHIGCMAAEGFVLLGEYVR